MKLFSFLWVIALSIISKTKLFNQKPIIFLLMLFIITCSSPDRSNKNDPENPDYDHKPPEIASTVPPDNADEVALNTIISTTFNEPMNSNRFSTESFELVQEGNIMIQGDLEYLPKKSTITFATFEDLLENTLYTATISSFIEDDVASANVYSIIASNGIVYIGGDFSTVDGTTRNNLAAISTDGVLQTWNPDADSWVFTMDTDGNIIFVGG
jgi:hypothetical protein